MVPVLERAAQGSCDNFRALVLSPTRELAQQTLKEGKLLSHFYGNNFGLTCLVGGVPIKRDFDAFDRGRCTVIVATPGRLNDHVENTPGFRDKLSRQLAVLVFDEADQLLDMGFRPAIERLLRAVESTATTRQTMLFSATLPSDVKKIANLAMRPGYAMIDVVGADDEETHGDVEQLACVSNGIRAQSLELCARLVRAVAHDPLHHKIVVFFSTARLTQFYAELFASAAASSSFSDTLNATTILEMHSRKSQSHRDKVSDTFRKARNAVLLSSDVSARGMDYPDVTLVIQFGAPADAVQYVHRLGRTARGDGRRGSGLILLADFERYFLQDPAVAKLPIRNDPPLVTELENSFASSLDVAALDLPDKTVTGAYQAWLGYHNSHLRKLSWSKTELVARANEWAAHVARRDQPPALAAKTLGKMNIKGTPGLVIESTPRNAAPGTVSSSLRRSNSRRH